jgi:acetyl-CoA/propionyl-CoA carboxylase biotin carboxyl carrier protein
VEFIVDGDEPDQFFFMEMNTRLQVEHPVTELVTRIDLVEEQLLVAAGQRLRFAQDDIELTGHAVEARVYAEDPARGFLPAAGRVLAVRWPAGDGVRVDSGIEEGQTVGTAYDPMLAKVVAWGPSRAVALQRLRAALADTLVLGLTTNTAFVRRLLADDDVVAGRLDTGLVERRSEDLAAGTGAGEAGLAVALGRLAERDPGPDADPFAVPSGWRIGGVPSWTHERLHLVGGPGGASGIRDVRVSGRAADARIEADDAPETSAAATLRGHQLHVRVGEVMTTWLYARDGETVWVGRDGEAWALREMPVRARQEEDDSGHGPLLAPMPGTVTAVHVAAGAEVAAGTAVITVEAMKMEHVVRAAADGVVSSVLVTVGQTVGMEDKLAVVEASASPR